MEVFIIKKLLLMFVIIFLIIVSLGFRTISTVKNIYYSSAEEVIKKNNEVKEVNLSYTIPNNYRKSLIVDYLLNDISFENNYIGNNYFYINIYLYNKSAYDYEYRDYSLKIKKGTTIFPVERVANLAIKDLYKTKLIEKTMLEDSMLNKKLISIGYRGIEDLTNYYLNYYNDLYGTNKKDLYDFSKEQIFQIFTGQSFGVLENNNNINLIANNFWYDNILEISFDGIKNFKVDEYSFFNEVGNHFCKEYFKLIETDHFQKMGDIKLIIDNKYMADVFQKYYLNISIQMMFDPIEK